jgi:DNA modification methylase
MQSVASQYTLHQGDSLAVLRAVADCSVDAVVTDPPYGLGKEPDALSMLRDWLETGRHEIKGKGFMGKTWDAFVPQPALWRECLRVLKPGGHLVAFGGTRTVDLVGLGLRIAGFEIRDQISWVYSTGFPKSHNLDGEHAGKGTALKPAQEPIILARKPLAGTVAANVLEWGTGSLNIDAGRIPTADVMAKVMHSNIRGGAFGSDNSSRDRDRVFQQHPTGRWPANLIHDGSEEVVALFPAKAGAAAPVYRRNGDKFRNTYGGFAGNIDEQGSTFHGDTGSAARFFYCAKPSRAERNEGCESLPDREWRADGACVPERENRPFLPSKNNHPTVKPCALMRYLCQLVTPLGGLILDPFLGSGTTGKAAILEGFRFTGIEREAEYLDIARARIEHSVQQVAQQSRDDEATPKQMTLFP